MDFKQNLSELLNSDNDIGKKIANQIKNINDALENGQISIDEAKDLLNDIEVEKKLVDLANDLKTKILVQEVIDGIIAIISNLPSIR